ARSSGARVLVTLHDYHLLCDAATLLRPDGELCALGRDGADDASCSACLRRHPILRERWGGLDPESIWTAAARARLERHRDDLARAHQVIAPSRFLARPFERAGLLRERDCAILRAGYPGPVLAPRRRDPGRPLRVGYVGGIYFSKGVHVLVRAFAHLAGEP